MTIFIVDTKPFDNQILFKPQAYIQNVTKANSYYFSQVV